MNDMRLGDKWIKREISRLRANGYSLEDAVTLARTKRARFEAKRMASLQRRIGIFSVRTRSVGEGGFILAGIDTARKYGRRIVARQMIHGAMEMQAGAAVAATPDIGFSVDTRDVEMAMARVNQYCNVNSKQGVLMMAREVATAAATATRVAPKTRRIVQKKPGEKRPRSDAFYAQKPNKSGSGITYIAIRAKDKASARASKKAQIKRRGLAKTSWYWIAGGLGKRSAQASKYGLKRSPKYYRVIDRHNDQDPGIELHDKLKYATDAFKTKGRATVNNIGQRAANKFIKKFERRIDRIAGEGTGSGLMIR
jgi:hypothetical protein